MEKRSALISGALVTGGMVAGSIFAPLGLASAQTDDAPTTPDSSSTPDSTESRDRGQKGEALAEFLGLTVDDLKSAREDDQSWVQIAADAGVSEADLVDYLVEQFTERIEARVESGRLTAEEAAEKIDGLEAKITEKVNALPSERENRGSNRRSNVREAVIEVFESFGVSGDDVVAARQSGQSLADIAADAGIAEADLVDALVAEATERVDASVEEGRIDADRAAEITENLEERIAERIDNEPGERGNRANRGARGGDSAET